MKKSLISILCALSCGVSFAQSVPSTNTFNSTVNAATSGSVYAKSTLNGVGTSSYIANVSTNSLSSITPSVSLPSGSLVIPTGNYSVSSSFYTQSYGGTSSSVTGTGTGAAESVANQSATAKGTSTTNVGLNTPTSASSVLTASIDSSSGSRATILSAGQGTSTTNTYNYVQPALSMTQFSNGSAVRLQGAITMPVNINYVSGTQTGTNATFDTIGSNVVQSNYTGSITNNNVTNTINP
jgi:hypothetical protein